MQKLKQIFTLILLVCVLISSHTFAMYQHTCLITGIIKNSFQQNNLLCYKAPEKKIPSDIPFFSKASCCKLDVKVFKTKPATINSDQSDTFFESSESVFRFNFEPIFSTFENQKLIIPTHLVRYSPKIYLTNQQFLI
jgi:hypothetical protein